MSIRFFGQFLLERGELDDGQLRQAFDLMEQENQPLGEMAIAAGFASAADCRRVHGEQRRKDLPFGELAVQMGVLNTVELEELLQLQRETRLPLAGALVALDLLSTERVRVLHDEFKSEQQDYDPRDVSLPAALLGSRVAEVTLSLLGRLLMRICGIEARVGPGAACEGLPDSVLIASIPVVGIHGMQVTMVVDERFGVKLASGLLGEGLGELAPELSLDAVGEFLNVLLGNSVSILEEEALELRLGAPSYGVVPTRGWCFEIATQDSGSAQVILEPVAAGQVQVQGL